MFHERSQPEVCRRHNHDLDLTESESSVSSMPEGMVAARTSGASTMLLDEQGNLYFYSPDRETRIFSPEEAFDLLDFLYTQRDFLSARSREALEGRFSEDDYC